MEKTFDKSFMIVGSICMRTWESIKMTDLISRCKYRNKKVLKHVILYSQRNICCFGVIYTVLDNMAV